MAPNNTQSLTLLIHCTPHAGIPCWDTMHLQVTTRQTRRTGRLWLWAWTRRLQLRAGKDLRVRIGLMTYGCLWLDCERVEQVGELETQSTCLVERLSYDTAGMTASGMVASA